MNLNIKAHFFIAANDLFDDSKIIEKQKSRFYTTGKCLYAK